MLNIYRGREDVDKEKFIYDHISGETLVLVPNQYTLVAERQALDLLETDQEDVFERQMFDLPAIRRGNDLFERQALKYTGKACLFDVEILTLNRLGRRLLNEKALENVKVLDKYGRFLLLSSIVNDNRDRLDIFKSASYKPGFIQMINDFIADFKNQGCGKSEIEEMIASDDSNELLKQKLRELDIILSEYNLRMEGKSLDTEDYVQLYIDEIKTSEFIKNKSIWVYGFDTLTARQINMVIELAAHAHELNFVLNESDHALWRYMRKLIMEEAVRCDVETHDFSIKEIALAEQSAGSVDYALNSNVNEVLSGENDVLSVKNETIKRIERGIAATNIRKIKEENKDFIPDGLDVYECANLYNEAENAAIYVYRLLRDEGYKMDDIAIICNDEEVMHPIMKRTFEEYGIPLFIDARRSVTDSQVGAFIVSMLEFVCGGYRTDAMISLLKSGLTGLPVEDIEAFENYVRSYGIKGSMWTVDFKYGRSAYSDEEFERFEEIRSLLMEKLLFLERIANESDTIEEFVTRFREYLEEYWQFEETLHELTDVQADMNMPEAAQRTVACYKGCIDILDQIVEISGTEKMDLEVFLTLYLEGIKVIDVGIIPPAQDSINMGTMIRTRPAPVKAVLIVGANEGVLPLEGIQEGLFSVDEEAYFEKRGFALGNISSIKMMEEQVAMYRVVSKPSEKLYVSYSVSDLEGKERKPSSLIDSLKTVFPKLKVKRDLIGDGFNIELLNSRRESLRHLINYIKEGCRQPGLDGADLVAAGALEWFKTTEPERLEVLLAAVQYNNDPETLSEELTRRLFANNGIYSLSPSRLEKYYRCPFQYFVRYGLVPEEKRDFKSGGVDLGNIFHECIRNVCERLTNAEREPYVEGHTISKGDPSAISEKWKLFSEEEILEIVDEEVTKAAEMYDDGLFFSNSMENYRLEYVRDLCSDAVIALVDQVKAGHVKESMFEKEVKRGGNNIKPVEMDIAGEKVYIEGKIDRADVLDDGTVRIIDYKTKGSSGESVNIDDVRRGYQMQLMIYLYSLIANGYDPAGMFYFNINDKKENFESDDPQKRANKLKEIQGRFLLDGIYIDDDKIRENMPVEIVRDKKRKKEAGVSRQDFEIIKTDAINVVEEVSKKIVTGEIKINPVNDKGDRKKPCKYCDYRAICRFDLRYRGNNYNLYDLKELDPEI